MNLGFDFAFFFLFFLKNMQFKSAKQAAGVFFNVDTPTLKLE